jgi:hypothetical protein
VVDVDIQRLLDAASAFNRYAEDFKKTAVPAVERCQIPWTAIPPLGSDFGQKYSASWEVLDLSIRAMPDLLGTIGKALNRVAHHYQGQEDANASMFTAPGMPAPREMSSAPGAGNAGVQSGVTALTGAATAWGDLRAIKSMADLVEKARTAGSIMRGGAVPYGALILAAVISVDVFAVLNMRDPTPYFSAGDGWSDLEKILNSAVADLPRMSYDVVYKDPKWSGSGADAFYAFVNDDLDRTLAAMSSLNNAMETACVEAGWSIAFAIVAYIAISLTTGAICDLAKLIPDPTNVSKIAVTHAALVMFMGYAIEIMVDLGEMYLFMTLAATQMGQAYDTLKQYLTNKDGTLDGNSLKLSVRETQSIATWENGGWDRKK